MAVDTERVISEVRQRSVLWNLSDNLYKDRDARQKAWTEICEALYPNFTDMESTKKKEIEKIIQQRWKTARDAYMRCKNLQKNAASGSAGVKKKMYIYSEEMTFLDKKYEVPLEDSINTDITDTVSQTLPDDSMDASTSNPDTEMLNQVNSPLSGTGDSLQNTTDIYKKKKNLRKRKYSENDDFNREMMTMFRENAKLFQNEDLSFFMSLLPLMETFSLQQKLIFRSEILKKAMEIANMVNPYETNSIVKEEK